VSLIPGSVKPDNKIGICCFSATHEVYRCKNKDWLAQSLPVDCCFKEI